MDAPTKPSPPDISYFGVWNAEDGPAHMFRCNMVALIIQTRSFFGDLTQNPHLRQEYRDNTAFDVEIIQTLLRYVKWGCTNYAYLVRGSSSGNYQLMYRNKLPRPITCHLWAPLIDEREVKVTRWLDPRAHREGVWRGREVSLMVMDCSDPHIAKQIGNEIDGARLLTALGYSFEVLGILTRNGAVFGIMTEIPTGRVVQYSDRAAVYDAVADLQKHGIIYRSISKVDIIITDEGIRFMQACTIMTVPEDEVEQLQEWGNIWHWPKLDELFEELKDSPNCMPLMRHFRPYCINIPLPPALYREVILDRQIIPIAAMEYRLKQIDPVRYSQRQWSVALGIAMKEANKHKASSSWDTESDYAPSDSSCTLSDSSSDVVDKPRVITRTVPRVRINADAAFHPYLKARSHRRPMRLIAPEAP